MRRSKHLVRAFMVIGIALLGFFVVRSYLIPPSYGAAGPYRFRNVPEQRAIPMVHEGRASCAGCHEDKIERLDDNKHKTVSCEGCHGLASDHADPALKDGPDKGKIADMPFNASVAACRHCHDPMDARPKKFSVVDVEEHLEEMEVELSERACVDGCHDPHWPKEK